MTSIIFGASTPVSVCEKITPAIASEYLAKMGKNRSLSPKVVKRYARAMNDGAWILTHQGIGFDVNGVLCDGQHRLQAVIKSGRTIEMMVTRGLPPKARAVVDSGRLRSTGERLVLGDIVNERGHTVAALANAMARLEDPYSAIILQPHEVEQMVVTDGEHMLWAFETFRDGRSLPWTALIRAPFAYCRAFARGQVEELARQVVDQAGFDEGSAGHAFVKQLVSGKLSTRSGTHERVHVMCRIMRLIKAHVDSERIGTVHGTIASLEWAWKERQKAGVDLLLRADADRTA